MRLASSEVQYTNITRDHHLVPTTSVGDSFVALPIVPWSPDHVGLWLARETQYWLLIGRAGSLSYLQQRWPLETSTLRLTYWGPLSPCGAHMLISSPANRTPRGKKKFGHWIPTPTVFLYLPNKSNYVNLSNLCCIFFEILPKGIRELILV